ncbi:MAG: type II toxin-antitoxin system VapC family toxin [Candidatus Competibacterales bacterium]|nr:type II toxin-antitoxin system VapC family toxin [Candidatus Competibacterales bacterium]
MLVDTDILIWNLRGNEKAAELLDGHPCFAISAVSYMELVQGLRDKTEFRALRRALRLWQTEVVAIDQAICARAVFLVEEYTLSHNMQMADALIAATALHLGATLVTANDRHYRHIDGLDIALFRP